jgi:hypothetical protein
VTDGRAASGFVFGVAGCPVSASPTASVYPCGSAGLSFKGAFVGGTAPVGGSEMGVVDVITMSAYVCFVVL